MHSLIRSFYTKPLVIYLVFALVVISTLSGPAEAMFLPSSDGAGPSASAPSPFERSADLKKIQTALESKTIRQRLVDYGLSSEEAMARLSALPDEKVHELAANLDSVQAGGDGVGVVVGLLLIAVLVVLLIYLIEGRVEIRRK